MSGCCPPGSWDAPLSDPANGSSATLCGVKLTIGQNTPIYYTCGAASSSADESTSSSSKGIVVFPDVWGFKSRITSIFDKMASNGKYHIVIFDPFRGDVYSDHKNDLIGWLSSVPYKPNVESDVNACIAFLTSKGVTRDDIGVIGFCWGCWAIAKTLSNGMRFKAAVWAHPSTGLEHRAHGGDEDSMIKRMDGETPILVMAAGNDDDRLKDGGEFAESIKANGGRAVDFPHMKHGFTTRGDAKNDAVRRDTEKALTLALEYFNEKLYRNKTTNN